jgi:AraC-like DNA-binding protein
MRIHSFGQGEARGQSAVRLGTKEAEDKEVIYITAGKLWFKTASCQRYIQEPAILIVPAPMRHGLSGGGTEPASYRYAVVAGGRLAGGDGAEPVVLHAARLAGQELLLPAAEAVQLFEHLYQMVGFLIGLALSGASASGRELEQLARLGVRTMVALLLPRQAGAPVSCRPAAIRSGGRHVAEEVVLELQRYMEWRYSESITVRSLAAQVHLTPSYLIRLFKEHTGYTPGQYLLRIRLKAAARYLQESDLPIKAIAEKIGFNSIHYFTRRFKHQYGDSPASWRKKLVI